MIRNIFTFLLAGVAFAAAPEGSIRIDPARVENHVSARMYAAFTEMMDEGVKWGMTAEMIHDRSFEESPNYLGLPAEWRVEPDERNDHVGVIGFASVTTDAYPRKNRATGADEHSLRVALIKQDIRETRKGFSQGRLSVVAGTRYDGYVWLKLPSEKPFQGKVTAALEEDNTDGETYARVVLPVLPGSDWQKLPFSLTPKKTDRFAKLSFLFNGTGILYLDEVSLESGNAKTQVRPDVEAKIAQLKPSYLRWPGGNVAQDYHWEWGVGPRDERPVWTNIAWSNAPEPGDFGTDEYLAFCARLHIEPSITVNVNGGGATAEEAAHWVEYVNGPASSKYGAMRAKNGHPEPYNVKQWELGNEVFGNWVRGHATAETYANAAVEYAKAMRAVDPTIKLIAVGEGADKEQEAWNSAVVSIAGPLIQYLAIHDYTSEKDNGGSNPRAAMMGRAAKFEESYRHTAELIRRLSPNHPIQQMVNEWNLFYSADVIESMEGALYAARMMDGFERDGGFVESNSISDLLNGWVGGVIQSSRDRVYGTAQFYAIKLYNDHLGTDRLTAQVQSPDLAPSVPSLDAVVNRSIEGSKVFVKMSNAASDQPLAVKIDLGSFAYARNVSLSLLSASSPLAVNTFSNPDAVKPEERTVHCSGICTITLPPESIAVATFTAR